MASLNNVKGYARQARNATTLPEVSEALAQAIEELCKVVDDLDDDVRRLKRPR